ncbi:MAG: hypothetical protein Fues2KO_07550 [Fuerstiella sp.]
MKHPDLQMTSFLILFGTVGGLLAAEPIQPPRQTSAAEKTDVSEADSSAGNQVAESEVEQLRQQITRGRILSTVSFLASDELAGRDTPSAELNIATAYVAARFRGANLEPLGDDDTFFQIAEVTGIKATSQPATLTIADTRKSHSAAVLLPPDKDVNITATAVPEARIFQADDKRVAIVDELKLPLRAATDVSYAVALVQRRVAALAAVGVEVVLMKVAADSPLSQLANRFREEIIHPRNELSLECAVVLVPDDIELTMSKIQISTPQAVISSQQVRNVVGVLRGQDPEQRDQAIVVSAHLDHIGRTNRGADKVNNGADDNASGVTAVLAIADALSSLKSPPPMSIIFVTFWGEEQGMKGSRQFVENSPWPLSDIVANVNIEMVGRPKEGARNKAWMTGWKHSNLGEVLNAGAQRAGVEIFHRSDVSEMLYTRSDNVSFVRRGLIAHSLSAGSLHADYHQPSDEWQKLDIDHMTTVVQGLAAGVLHLSRHSDQLQKQ